MNRLALVVLCSSLFVRAQSFTLASSGDGSVLHMATNLYLKGEPIVFRPSLPPPTSTRIYRHSAVPEIVLDAPGDRYLNTPYVSGDGLTTGSFSYVPCFGSCMSSIPRDVVALKRAGKDFEYRGNGFRVSRNGRFVFDSGFPNLDPIPTLRDLDTNKSYEFGRVLPRHSTQSLSDEGTLLSTEPGSLAGIGDPTTYAKILLTPLGQTPILLFEGGKILPAAITSNGNFVFVLQELPAAHFRLLEIDLATRIPRQLWEGDTKPLGCSKQQ